MIFPGIRRSGYSRQRSLMNFIAAILTLGLSKNVLSAPTNTYQPFPGMQSVESPAQLGQIFSECAIDGCKDLPGRIGQIQEQLAWHYADMQRRLQDQYYQRHPEGPPSSPEALEHQQYMNKVVNWWAQEMKKPVSVNIRDCQNGQKSTILVPYHMALALKPFADQGSIQVRPNQSCPLWHGNKSGLESCGYEQIIQGKGSGCPCSPPQAPPTFQRKRRRSRSFSISGGDSDGQLSDQESPSRSRKSYFDDGDSYGNFRQGIQGGVGSPNYSNGSSIPQGFTGAPSISGGIASSTAFSGYSNAPIGPNTIQNQQMYNQPPNNLTSQKSPYGQMPPISSSQLPSERWNRNSNGSVSALPNGDYSENVLRSRPYSCSQSTCPQMESESRMKDLMGPRYGNHADYRKGYTSAYRDYDDKYAESSAQNYQKYEDEAGKTRDGRRKTIYDDPKDIDAQYISNARRRRDFQPTSYEDSSLKRRTSTTKRYPTPKELQLHVPVIPKQDPSAYVQPITSSGTSSVAEPSYPTQSSTDWNDMPPPLRNRLTPELLSSLGSRRESTDVEPRYRKPSRWFKRYKSQQKDSLRNDSSWLKGSSLGRLFKGRRNETIVVKTNPSYVKSKSHLERMKSKLGRFLKNRREESDCQVCECKDCKEADGFTETAYEYDDDYEEPIGRYGRYSGRRNSKRSEQFLDTAYDYGNNYQSYYGLNSRYNGKGKYYDEDSRMYAQDGSRISKANERYNQSFGSGRGRSGQDSGQSVGYSSSGSSSGRLSMQDQPISSEGTASTSDKRNAASYEKSYGAGSYGQSSVQGQTYQAEGLTPKTTSGYSESGTIQRQCQSDSSTLQQSSYAGGYNDSYGRSSNAYASTGDGQTKVLTNQLRG